MKKRQLKRKNNKIYDYYKGYDATDNKMLNNGKSYKTFNNIRKSALETQSLEGSTVEIIGYKNGKDYIVAREEDFKPKKQAHRVKKTSCGKFTKKRRKGARKSKKGLLSKILSW